MYICEPSEMASSHWIFRLIATILCAAVAKLQDHHPDCQSWALRGECAANPNYMLVNCERSCKNADKERKKRQQPRTKQTREEVAAILEKFESCDVAEESRRAALVQEGEDRCVQECQEHADCLKQCQALSPRSLHRLVKECAPWRYLSESSASWGMHVTCVIQAPKTCAETAMLLVIFPDGRTTPTPLIFEVPPSQTTGLDTFIQHAEALVGKPQRGQLYQAAGFFTARGDRFLNIQTLSKGSLVFMVEGGQWIWPGVRIGHEVKFLGLRNPGETTTIRTVSLVPAVFEIDHFLHPAESTHMIERVKNTIQKSPVALKDADRNKQAKEFRTSSQRFLSTAKDDILEAVDARVQELTRVPITHAEDIQVLRYNLNEHYSAHHDFFDPAAYKKDRNILSMIQNGATNRMATVFFYLTNVTRGGETNFPMAGGRPTPRDYFDCSKGFSSFPKANKVIIFYSMLPNGFMDDHALHGGCDVLEGQKWSANFWLWNKPNPLNSDHQRRMDLAKSIGAVGNPDSKEVKYSTIDASSNFEL